MAAVESNCPGVMKPRKLNVHPARPASAAEKLKMATRGQSRPHADRRGERLGVTDREQDGVQGRAADAPYHRHRDQ